VYGNSGLGVRIRRNRQLEEAGRARATVARRLCTVAGFYPYAEEEGLVATSPAVHVRRPRLDYESHAIGLDRRSAWSGATVR
jgi:site-specific recombinase XerD